jgi:hypothetical protein
MLGVSYSVDFFSYRHRQQIQRLFIVRDFGFAGPTKFFLLGPSFVDPSAMTIERCVGFCDQQNTRLAGIESGNECRVYVCALVSAGLTPGA